MDLAKILEVVEKNLYDDSKYESFLKNNFSSFINFFQKDEVIKAYKNENQKCAAILQILNFYFPLLNQTDGDFYICMKTCWSIYYSENTFKNYPIVSENYVHNLFHSFMIKNEVDQDYIDFLKKVNQQYEKKAFCSAKAFLCYYAYKTKDFKMCESILNELAISLDSDNYNKHFDYVLMNYYKGIIFLSQEKYNDAAICFMLCLHSRSNHMRSEYTYHQLESVRRLTLLISLVTGDLRKDVLQCLSINDATLLIKPMEPYLIMKTLSNNSKSTYEEFMKIGKDYKKNLKEDNTYVS